MSTKKRGLGKGLSALISNELLTSQEEISEDSILNIDINKILPNKNQPRLDFNEESLKELGKSIEIYGIIQPILVQKIKEGYEIIAGERRFKAAKIAGLKEVPAIIKKVGPEESAKIALIENIQRKDLNPIEEAEAYRKLIKEFNLTQEELAAQIGKSRSYISNSMRLLNLDNRVIEKISEGKLSQGHGKVLLSIKDKNIQKETAEKILKENLNVRDTEAMAKDKKANKDLELEESLNSSYIKSIEEKLMRTLGTKVNLIKGNKKGKIEIEYYNDEDLQRIIENLIN